MQVAVQRCRRVSVDGGKTARHQCKPCTLLASFSAFDNRDRCQTDLKKCAINQYETAAPTTSSDRTCSAHDVCTDNSPAEYQAKAPTKTTDRLCEGAGAWS